MLDYFRLDGIDFHDYVGLTGNRDIVSIDGLVGLTDPRILTRNRTEKHGSSSRGKFLSGRTPTLKGEIWGNDLVGAYREHRIITSILYRSLREGAKLATWREGNATVNDPRVGLANLAPNPSVENDLASWSAAATGYIAGGAAISRVAATPARGQVGAQMMRLLSTGAVSQGATLTVPGTFKAGRTYLFRAVLNNNGGTAPSIRGYLGRANASAFGQSVVGPLGSNANVYTLATQWTPGADDATVVATFEVTTAVVADVYIDQVMVIDVTGMTAGQIAAITYFDGDTAPGAIWLGNAHASASCFVGPAYQAKMLLAGPMLPPLEEGAALLRYDVALQQDDPRAYLHAPHTAVSAALAALAKNYITNPSFEVNLAGWTAGGVNAPTRVITDHAIGVACAQVINAAAVDSYQFTTVTLPVGTYTLSGYVKNAALAGAGLGAGIQLQQGTGIVTGGNKFVGYSKLSRDWTRVSVTFVVTTAGTFNVYTQLDTATGSAWFDGISVVAGALQDYFDGTSLGAGWDGAAHASTSQLYGADVSAINPGNIETPPVVRLYGPLTAPAYKLLATGERVTINGNLVAGDVLEVDHAAPSVRLNGVLAPEKLNGAGSQLFDIPGAPEGQARVPQTVRMLGTPGAAGNMQVDCRGAYVL